MLKYQPEVDGLRALAVLPVLLFHAGFPQFGGGFVGVDVFFVISGYLITGIIATELREESFSIIDFYERRIRRIIPALMLVMLVSILLGLILFLPYQLVSLGYSALAASLFVSNFWFWSHTGYFEGVGHMEPLLHTWSLAVEEQFYLFFPLGLIVLRKLRLSLLPAVIFLFGISLVSAELLISYRPSATFYLLPTRCWELALGGLMALGAMPRLRSPSARDAAALAGLVLIVGPVLIYGSDTRFPGLAALPPCLGAAMIIAAGKQGGGRVVDLIGSRWPVAIGLVSYSLYLWHWPVFVFSRQLLASPDLPPNWAVGGILLSGLLAWFTWRFVEAPFRNRALMSRRRVFRAAGAMSLLVGAAAIGATTGVPERFDSRTLSLAAGREDVAPQVLTCIERRANDRACRVGADASPSFAVWSDSHGAAMGSAFDLAGRARRRGGMLFAFNGCPPGIDAPSPTLTPPDQVQCRDRNRAVLARLIREESVDTIVLVAFWQNYLDRSPARLLASLTNTASTLRGAGKKVVVLANLPIPGHDVPWVSALAEARGYPAPMPLARPPVDSRLSDLALRSGMTLIDLSDAFCREMVCPVEQQGMLLFVDGNHVSNGANVTRIAPYLLRRGVL